MNTISLLGRLTAEPELKTTTNGNSVTSFTLAVDRAYTPKGEERQTDFINIVAWRQTAEFVTRYFHKGQRMALVGSLQSRKYTDKDGNNRTAYEVVADHVFFADGKQENNTSYAVEAPAYTTSKVPPVPSPAPAPIPQQQGFSTATAQDFEEITMDEDLPF